MDFNTSTMAYHDALYKLREGTKALSTEEGSNGVGVSASEVHSVLLCLRESNRTLCQLVRDRRKAVASLKNAMDRAELKKQALLYQQSYLEATIEQTKEHPSIYRTLPINFNDLSINTIDPSFHQEVIRRLNEELDNRKSLNDKFKSHNESYELAKSRHVLKKKELEKLKDQLDQIIRSADPLLLSHSRLFADLEKNSTMMNLEGEEDNTSLNTPIDNTPLERILQEWINFIESDQSGGNKEKLIVKMFDELEQGEDPNIMDLDFNNGENINMNLHESDFDDSASIAVSNPDQSKRDNIRSADKNRKFPHAYINVDIKFDERRVHLYFYRAMPTNTSSPIVLKMTIDNEECNGEDNYDLLEQRLLSLNVDSILKLTYPHESIVPGKSGHISFRWIQSMAGLVPDPSFNDSSFIFTNLIEAISKFIQSEN